MAEDHLKPLTQRKILGTLLLKNSRLMSKELLSLRMHLGQLKAKV